MNVREKHSYIFLSLFISSVIVMAVDGAITLDRASIRLSYVDQQERLTRHSASAEAPDFSSTNSKSITASAEDTLLAQASCQNTVSGENAFPQQAFLRIVREDTGADAVYIMRKKSTDMRVEISFHKEIRADKEFWSADASYRVEIIVGDTDMTSGITWIAIKSLKFQQRDRGLFAAPVKGVFEFDNSVKKHVLPEFSSPIRAGEKQAPLYAVMIALVALLAPFPLILYVWNEMGMFPFVFPKERSKRASVAAFEICTLLIMGALFMFWWQWNIIQTWKVIGVLMIPTVISGHRVLSDAAEKFMMEKRRKTKSE